MWQSTWGYRESAAVTGGILLVGWLLQLTVGAFDFYLLAYPVNLGLGIGIALLCAASWPLRTRPLMQWFTGVSFSVCQILALLVLSLIMGLTPQAGQSVTDLPADFVSRLGFNRMTSSWPFVLLYFCLLLSLGCLIVRRLAHFSLKDYAFYLNHLGLWLVLAASGLGYADMERYVMHVREGEVEWRVYADDGSIKKLPIAIQLNDFDMEEYPPKLTVINRESGLPQPEASPDYYSIDTDLPEGQLNAWDIYLEKYIHQAIRNSDSTYREVPMPGATPAALIRAVNRESGTEVSGWVCGGNQAQLYMTLPLNEQTCVVMTAPEPKRFLSDIEVYTPEGETKKAILEVNKPLRVGNWTIYQYGYDNKAGRLSSYSSMELVYDPAILPVYIGFVFLAIGAASMVFNGSRIRRRTALNSLHKGDKKEEKA